MDEEEIDGVKSPIKRLGSTRKLLVFNSEFSSNQSPLDIVYSGTPKRVGFSQLSTAPRRLK
jgi:hypothetical protein